MLCAATVNENQRETSYYLESIFKLICQMKICMNWWQMVSGKSMEYMSLGMNLKGKSTDFENIYQNLTFFEDIKNMWIKILRSFPIKSYEHIFGIKVNPSSFFGGATFLVSYFSPPLILQFLHELGVISSFFGGQINFVSSDYNTWDEFDLTPKKWRNNPQFIKKLQNFRWKKIGDKENCTPK